MCVHTCNMINQKLFFFSLKHIVASMSCECTKAWVKATCHHYRANNPSI